MNALRGLTVAVVSLAATIQFSDAAKVMPIKGEVLVSSGTGYQRIDGEVVLKPGDSAIANPGAQAALVYDDGCVVDVVPGMVAWVEPTSPCGAGSRGLRDPDPIQAAPKAFDPGWLLDGAATAKRRTTPAAP
jgi:hypothetical protein